MQWTTAYDLATVGYRDGLWFAFGGAVALVGLLWVRRARRRGAPAGAAWMMFAIGLVAGLGGGGVPLWDHHRLLAELEAGRAQVAEGPIASHTVELVRRRQHNNFHRYDSSTWEAFRVADVAFGFYRGSSPVGFINSDADRVELRDGMTVRVHYVEDVPGDFAQRRILRLEVARVATAAPGR